MVMLQFVSGSVWVETVKDSSSHNDSTYSKEYFEANFISLYSPFVFVQIQVLVSVFKIPTFPFE